MNTSFNQIRGITAGSSLLLAGVMLTGANGQEAGGQPASDKDLAHQIFDTMLKLHGNEPGHRPVHAKGIVGKQASMSNELTNSTGT